MGKRDPVAIAAARAKAKGARKAQFAPRTAAQKEKAKGGKAAGRQPEERRAASPDAPESVGLGRWLEASKVATAALLQGGADSDGTAADISGEDDERFFKDRLDLVPIEFLVPPEEEPEDAWISRKFHKNTKKAAPKQAVKEASKKAKRNLKFIAAEQPRNLDLIKEYALRESEIQAESEGQGAEAKPKAKPARNVAELRERLAAKMASFKSDRSRDEAKPEKRKRGAVSKERGKKEGRKGAGNTGKGKANGSEAQSQKEAGEDPANGGDGDIEQKLRDDLTASISFGAIANGDGAGAEAKMSAKNKKNKNSTKNLLNVKRMIQRAEENKAVLEELKKSTNPADRERAKDKMWDSIEAKAKGATELEPKHLRKIAKRLEKKKQKSAESWAVRKEALEGAKTEKIEKRETNLAGAKKKRVENRLKRKGVVVEPEPSETKRKRPGFEGKHDGFLNGAKDSKPAKSGRKYVPKSQQQHKPYNKKK